MLEKKVRRVVKDSNSYLNDGVDSDEVNPSDDPFAGGIASYAGLQYNMFQSDSSATTISPQYQMPQHQMTQLSCTLY